VGEDELRAVGAAAVIPSLRELDLEG
jgi:hypothetical protein